jgi:hypothetical protein
VAVVERSTPSIVDIEFEILSIASTMAGFRSRLIALIGEVDASGGWARSGALSCAHWLAALLDIELSTAREQTRVARALRKLPSSRAAFDAGEISYAKVRQLTRVATADTEDELLALADQCPAGALARTLADWHRRADPEAAAKRAHEDRGMSTRTLPTGNRLITIELPAEDTAAFESAIDLEMVRAPAGACEPGASLRQQRADAFVRLTDRLSGPGAPPYAPGTPIRAELVLHRRVGETTLIDGTPLPPEAARRLTCDADVRLMTHWPNGSPADVGRRHRFITPRLRRLVHERANGSCEHPGCTARHFLEIHHIVHWNDGGATTLSNLKLLCSHHHRASHRMDPSAAKGSPTPAWESWPRSVFS